MHLGIGRAEMHLGMKKALDQIDPDGSRHAQAWQDLLDAGLLSGAVPRMMSAHWFGLLSTWTLSVTLMGMPIDVAREWRDAVLSAFCASDAREESAWEDVWPSLISIASGDDGGESPDVPDALHYLEDLLRVAAFSLGALCASGSAEGVVRIMTETGHEMTRRLNESPS